MISSMALIQDSSELVYLLFCAVSFFPDMRAALKGFQKVLTPILDCGNCVVYLSPSSIVYIFQVQILS